MFLMQIVQIFILASISVTTGQNTTKVWFAWFPCSDKCFVGTRYRHRNCTGSRDANCSFLETQTEPCNTGTCSSNNTAFMDTVCNASCNNIGWLKRSRYCLDGKPVNTSCEPPRFYPCTGACNKTTTIAATTTVTNSGNATTWIAVGISAGFLLFLLMIVACCVIYRKKKAKKTPYKTEEGEVNEAGPSADRPDEVIEETYTQTHKEATEKSRHRKPEMVESIIYSRNPEDSYDQVHGDKETNTTGYDSPINMNQQILTKPKKGSELESGNYEQNAYDQLHDRGTTNNAHYDTTNHVSQIMPSSLGDYNHIDVDTGGHYDQPTKVVQVKSKNPENAYDHIHGETTKVDSDYDTTNFMPQSNDNYTQINVTGRTSDKEPRYDVPQGGVDENANVNSYESVTGISDGYSSLQVGREENATGYDQLQHNTVTAAYDFTD